MKLRDDWSQRGGLHSVGSLVLVEAFIALELFVM